MSMTIRGGVGMLPNGVQFKDPILGKVWDDTHTLPTERAHEVLIFRSQNAEKYTDPKWFDAKKVYQEIVDYNGERLKWNSYFFLDVSVNSTVIKASQSLGMPPLPPRTCPKCNFELVPRYCKTCSSHQLQGWDCPSCGFKE